MSIEDDIARVHQVTEKLVGPQKVWVLTQAWIDKHGCSTGASVYLTKDAALDAFHGDIFDEFVGMQVEEVEADKEADRLRDLLDTTGKYIEDDDANTTWSLTECEVRA